MKARGFYGWKVRKPTVERRGGHLNSQEVLHALEYVSASARGSHELLCYGLHVTAYKVG